jgi:hypothetical protein
MMAEMPVAERLRCSSCFRKYTIVSTAELRTAL